MSPLHNNTQWNILTGTVGDMNEVQITPGTESGMWEWKNL